MDKVVNVTARSALKDTRDPPSIASKKVAKRNETAPRAVLADGKDFSSIVLAVDR